MDLLEDGEHRHGVHRGDEAGEHETLCSSEVSQGTIVSSELSQHSPGRQSIQTVAYREGVEEGAEDSKDHDGDKVVKECFIIESESRVEDDWRKKNLKE